MAVSRLPECFWQCLKCRLDSERINLAFGAGISGCVALKELNCEGCRKLTSLGGIGGCTALEKLYLYGCRCLASLGDAIGGLTSVTYLDVSCTAIKELPETIGGLTSLTYLNVCYSAIKELPESLVQQLKSQGCTIELQNGVVLNYSRPAAVFQI